MAPERQTSSQTTTPQESPTDKRYKEFLLAQQEAVGPEQTEVQKKALSLAGLTLTGGELPGYLKSLPFGITPEEIATESELLVRRNMPQFQQLGLADSGVAYRETVGDVAKEVALPAKQFNIQNLAQLLNLAVGGQAQVQQPILAGSALLQNQLNNVRATTTTGTTTSNQNPFLKAFATGLGTGFGTGVGTTLGTW